MRETGFLKKRMEDTTTATRFMVLPTLKVTGVMPRSRTMYEACRWMGYMGVHMYG